MKTVVVTLASGEYFLRMAALTHPTLREYAERIGADFIHWTDASGYKIPEYKKMEVAGLLETYDRVLYVDTDVIIRDDAPNVFDVVPYDQLGMLEESRYYDRRIGVLRFMEHVGFDSMKWNGKYYNAGIFVCSRVHRDVFARPPVEWDFFRDQTWFNTLIADRGVPVFSLPYRFNRVLAFDRFYGEDRLDAYFLHYAGISVVRSREETLEIIAHDLAAWRQARPDYRFRDNVAIVVQGDLGEQAAAEPATRYARDVLYAGDNLVVASNHPELFTHLGLPVYSQVEQIPSHVKYHKRFTREKPDAPRDELRRQELSYHQVHGVQLAALLALGVQLPRDYVRPQFPVAALTLAAVTAKIPGVPLNRLVVLHPGQAAAASTFPTDVWQSYADALIAAGLPVAVVGDAVVGFDRSRTIDLVGQLSTAELLALVSVAPVLIASDSPPVQIAAAFDNWIGLIAPWRHPDYVLPWRNDSQTWRSETLQRAPLYLGYLQKPSGGKKPDLDRCDDALLRSCLPTAERVVAFAHEALSNFRSTQ